MFHLNTKISRNFRRLRRQKVVTEHNFSQNFPKVPIFRRLRRRKSGHWTAKVIPPFWGVTPPYSSPDSHPKPKKAVFSTQSPSLVSDVSRCFLHRMFCPIFLFQSIVFLDGKFKVLKIFDGKSRSYGRVSLTQTDKLSQIEIFRFYFGLYQSNGWS